MDNPLKILSRKRKVPVSNPAAPGFNAAGSDSVAIQIADQVMYAQGGRKAWDKSRYFYWNFFGRRSLLWDKNGGKVRIEIPDDQLIIIAKS